MFQSVRQLHLKVLKSNPSLLFTLAEALHCLRLNLDSPPPVVGLFEEEEVCGDFISDGQCNSALYLAMRDLSLLHLLEYNLPKEDGQFLTNSVGYTMVSATGHIFW